MSSSLIHLLRTLFAMSLQPIGTIAVLSAAGASRGLGHDMPMNVSLQPYERTNLLVAVSPSTNVHSFRWRVSYLQRLFEMVYAYVIVQQNRCLEGLLTLFPLTLPIWRIRFRLGLLVWAHSFITRCRVRFRQVFGENFGIREVCIQPCLFRRW